MKTTYDRIKERRKALHLTADQIAEELGVSRATVYRYETPEIEKASYQMIEKLAKVLKTTADYLLCRTDDPEFRVVRFNDSFQNIDQYKTLFTTVTSKQEETIETGNISDGEYQMLRIIYYALTPKNRTRIVGIMQEMLINQQKGVRDDD